MLLRMGMHIKYMNKSNQIEYVHYEVNGKHVT